MGVSLLERRRQILLNTPHIETVSGSMASFNTDISMNLKECKVYFSPVQEGSGDPSPDNVRPISGWDGITVKACGKNLAEKIYGLDSNGGNALSTVVTERGEDNTVSSLIPVRSGCTYKMSCTGQTASARHFWFDDYPLNNPKPVSIGGTYSISGSYTAPENAKWLFVVWTRQENVNTCGDVQIELGSTATTYEPYTATTLTIPFNRTIYGGYVDLVRGEVVETQTKVVLDGVNVRFNRGSYTNNNFYGAGWVYATPSGQSYYNNYDRSLYLCDRLIVGITGNETEPNYGYPNTGSLYYVVRVLSKADYPDELTTTQVMDLSNEWLTENPLTLVYPLSTPNTYSLTPETIKALKGINNIWSNANGNIEVKFWSH